VSVLATGTGTAAKKAGPLVFRLLENQSQFASKKKYPSAWISPRFFASRFWVFLVSRQRNRELSIRGVKKTPRAERRQEKI
jgi:hypothetical protein